jgi:hypothetical protein
METTTNKKIKNASRVIYDGVTFRSKLEVYCYKKLKEANIDFTYENNTYNLIPAFNYGGSLYEPYKKPRTTKWLFEEKDSKIHGMSYKPDFVGDNWIIECKGKANDAFPLRWKLFKYLLTQLHLNYDLYLPKNQTHIDECVRLIIEKQNAGRKRLL